MTPDQQKRIADIEKRAASNRMILWEDISREDIPWLTQLAREQAAEITKRDDKIRELEEKNQYQGIMLAQLHAELDDAYRPFLET